MSKQINNGFYKWDKSEFLKTKIENNRNLTWYKKRYGRNLNISIGLVIFSFIIVSFACYNIKSTADDRELFITSTSGDVVHYEMTEKKRKLLLNALDEINRNGNK